MPIAVLAGDNGTIFQPSPIGLPASTTATNAVLTTPTITAPVMTSAQASPASGGAVTITSGTTVLLSHTSAGAYSVAAPGSVGIRMSFTTTTDFAHVVTFTGGTLWDGTAGANTTWTAAAVQGSSLTIESVSATKWNVISFNLGTIAP